MTGDRPCRKGPYGRYNCGRTARPRLPTQFCVDIAAPLTIFRPPWLLPRDAGRHWCRAYAQRTLGTLPAFIVGRVPSSGPSRTRYACPRAWVLVVSRCLIRAGDRDEPALCPALCSAKR
jgi:hypothetical protein